MIVAFAADFTVMSHRCVACEPDGVVVTPGITIFQIPVVVDVNPVVEHAAPTAAFAGIVHVYTGVDPFCGANTFTVNGSGPAVAFVTFTSSFSPAFTKAYDSTKYLYRICDGVDAACAPPAEPTHANAPIPDMASAAVAATAVARCHPRSLRLEVDPSRAARAPVIRFKN